MIGWAVRVFLIVAGTITGWFVARDATNFGVLQMFIMLMLITITVAGVALWPVLFNWIKQRKYPPNR